jgi:phage repressor protein C with HTH and peptisase S24 domain
MKDFTARFVEVVESLGQNGYKLDGVGCITKQKVSNIKKGLTDVKTEVVADLCVAFPEVNANYILTGSGSMFLDNNEKVIEPNGEGDSIKTLPRIPYDAAAGSLTDAVEGVTEYQCERIPVVAAFPKYDFTIRVSGRSMEPYYFSGDEVACLRINEARFIQWGRVHVLDTTQGVLIKRIYDNVDSIRCVSYNPEYADFNVPKEDIFSYNLVVGALRL